MISFMRGQELVSNRVPTLGGLEACASVDLVVFYESIGFFKYNLERPKDTNNNGTGTSDTTKGALAEKA